MTLVVAGLGNKGEEYEKTRHNAGRDAVKHLASVIGFEDFNFNKKANALMTTGVVGKVKITLMLPETYVNLSGKSVSAIIKNPKSAKNLLVIHDDLDLPLGTIKMVFGRGSGGHKGVENIMRAIKTQNFARIRIGISAVGKKNQARKVSGSEKIIKHVIGMWTKNELGILKNVFKKIIKSIDILITSGLDPAVQFTNTQIKK